MSIAKAIAKAGRNHEILIALNGLLPDAQDAIRSELSSVLPANSVKVWSGVGPVREIDTANHWRCQVSERIRESFLASLQPDVILVTSLFEGLGDDAVCSVDLLGHGIPTAVVLYDLIPLINPDEHFRSSVRHRKWYQRKIQSLKRSKILLAISESSRREALSTGFFNENSVRNISTGCNEEFGVQQIKLEEREELWRTLRISRPFVMYTGGADERKNLHRLIESYAALPQNIRQKHQLVFVGKMPSGNIESFSTTAKRCGLTEGEFIITGYVEDRQLIQLYNTCKLFVFPSTHEGFGIPPLEAMRCGAPVITSNATSLPEVVGLHEAQFDPLSTIAMTEALERALTDEVFITRLKEHGCKQQHLFSWKRSADAALDALEEMVALTSWKPSKHVSIEPTARFEKRRLRILVVKLDHLGDFILAIPAFSKLKAKYPYASISIAVGSWNVAIAQQLKIFDEIYQFDFFKRRSDELPSEVERITSEFIDRIGYFDIAIDMRRPADTRFLLGRIHADLRVGYSTLDEAKDGALDVALPTFPDVPFRATRMNRTSISLQMLRLIDAIPGNPNDFVTFPDLSDAPRLEVGRVAIFPKAGNPAREWGSANFERLVRLLIAEPLVKGVDIYFADTLDRSAFTFDGDRKINVHVGLQFSELTSALVRASVCVANNSGGAHLASYLGIFVLAIYSGHELPLEWGPQFFSGSVIHRVAGCAPCHGARTEDCPNGIFCLTEIKVEDVYQKTMEALGTRCAMGDAHKKGGITSQHSVVYHHSTDVLIRNLISSIAEIGGGMEDDLKNAAMAIASNHPDYLVSEQSGVRLNIPMDHRCISIDWRGFSGIEQEFRWTDGRRSAMVFECPQGTPSYGFLVLKLDTLDQQRITVNFNGKMVSQVVRSGSHIQFEIPVDNLESGLNILELELPDARAPGNGDARELGVAVREFEVRVDQSQVGFV